MSSDAQDSGAFFLEIENDIAYIGTSVRGNGWPTTVGAYGASTANGNMVLTKIQANATFGYSTYFGGDGASTLGGIAINNGELSLTGFSQKNDFYITPDAPQQSYYGDGSDSEAVIAKVDATGQPTFGTYMGGSNEDTGQRILVNNGDIYITGSTLSHDFPTTPDAYQNISAASGSLQDAFIARIGEADCPSNAITNNSITPITQEVCISGTVGGIDGTPVEVDTDLLPTLLRDGVSEMQGNFQQQYQWQVSEDNGGTWLDIPGATIEDYLPAPLVADAHFRRLAYFEGCPENISNESLVDVNANNAPTLPSDTIYYKCSSNTIALEGTASGGTAPYTYQWSPAGGLSSTTVDDPTTNTTVSTIYVLEVTDDNGCIFTEQYTVIAYDADAGPDVSACQGTGVQIGTSHVAPGSSAITYLWSPADGLSATDVAQPIANPVSTTTYTLQITGPDGCTVSDEVVVTPFTVTADAGPDLAVCQGDTELMGEAAEAGYTYGWAPGLYINSQTIAQPTFSSGVFPNPNPYTYTVTKIHDATGCSDTDEVEVLVNHADAGIDGCGPRYIGTPDHSSGAAVFTWSVISGDATSIVGQENVVMPFIEPDETTLYHLSVNWNGAICTDQVLVPPCGCLPPDPQAISDIGCAAGSPDFNLVVYATNIDTSLYNYLWSPTTGIPDPTSPYAQAFTATLSVATTYTVTATLKTDNDVFCSEDMTIYPSTVAVPAVNPQGGTTCSGTPLQIGESPVSGWTYSWLPTTGLSNPDIANPTADPSTTTQYILTTEDNVTGCQAKDTVTVVIEAVIADAGPDGAFCENAIIQIGSPALPGVSYAWEPAGALSAPTTAQPIDTVFASTTYYLTTTLDSNPVCIDQDTVTYSLVSPPTADAGSDVSVCEGGSGTEIGSTPIMGYTYTWNPTTGLSDPNIANPIANPTSTTTYIVQISDGNQGCFDTDEVVVTVDSAIPIDAGDDKTICLGASTQIGTADQTGGTATYLWAPATGLDDATSPTPTANPTTTTTYTLQMTAAGGCVTTDEMTVTVDEPQADAGADKIVCEDGSVEIGSTALAGYTYSWTPSATLDDATAAMPNASPTSNTTYTVEVTSAEGCTATDQVVVSIQTITADAGADVAACTSSGVTIGTASAGSEFSYLWTPNLYLDDNTLAQPTTTATETIEYILKVTHTISGCLAYDTVTVTPSTVADAGNNATICSGESTQIGSPAEAGVTYSWNPTTGLDNAGIAQPTASPSTTTTYTLTATGSGGCKVTDQITITVNQGPTIDAGANETICLGSCVEIGETAQANVAYQWFPVNGLSDANTSNPTACPTTTTTYTLTATNLFTGCSSSDEVTVNVPQIPAPDADAGLDITLCPGESSSIGTPLEAGLSYSWNPILYLDNPYIAQPTFTAPGTPDQTYTYTLTVTNDATGCSNTDVVVINVSPLPTTPAVSDVSVCVDGIVELCTDCVAQTDYTYSWTPTTGLDNPNSINPIASITESTLYTLSIVNTLTSCEEIVTVDVTLQADTAPTADAGADVVVCSGETASIGGTDEGHTYSWGPSTLTAYMSPDASSASINFTPPTNAAYTLVLTVTSAEGCMATDTVEVVAYEEAPVEAGGNQFVCGTSTSMAATALSEGTGTWTLVSGPSIPTITAVNSPTTAISNLQVGEYIFRWTVSGANICNAGAFDQVTIEVESAAIDAGSDQFVCAGEVVQLNAAETASGSWSGGSGAFLNANTNTAQYTPDASEAGDTVRLYWTTDGNACPADVDSLDLFISLLEINQVQVGACNANQASVGVEVHWENAPDVKAIEVTIGGNTQTIDITTGSTGTQILNFTVTADGSTKNLITTEFAGGSCTVTDTYDAPVGCCPGGAKCGRVTVVRN